MEYVIKHKNLRGLENLSFQIDLKKITKSAKNRSYPNLSNCCGVKLAQKKFCSNCSTEVTETPKSKEFKLGKESVAVPTEHLETIKKSLDSNVILIDSYRDAGEIDPLFFTDIVFSSKQYKKVKKEYVEYAELLKMANKVGTGVMVFNSRPYPVMAYHYKGHICFRLLKFAEEIDPQPEIDFAPVNDQKIQLLSKLLDMNKADAFDIDSFVNTRAEKEQELIEMVLEGKELPEIKREEIAQPDETDEIERLQKLLEATA